MFFLKELLYRFIIIIFFILTLFVVFIYHNNWYFIFILELAQKTQNYHFLLNENFTLYFFLIKNILNSIIFIFILMQFFLFMMNYFTLYFIWIFISLNILYLFIFWYSLNSIINYYFIFISLLIDLEKLIFSNILVLSKLTEYKSILFLINNINFIIQSLFYGYIIVLFLCYLIYQENWNIKNYINYNLIKNIIFFLLAFYIIINNFNILQFIILFLFFVSI